MPAGVFEPPGKSPLGGAQSAPRPCARRPSPRAKVAQGMPENPTLPAHALGAAFHAGAFRLALGRTRSLAHRTRVGPGPRPAPCPPDARCHDIQVKFPIPSRASRPSRGPAVGREWASFPYPRHPSSARWSSRAGPGAFGRRSDGGRPGPKGPRPARARGSKSRPGCLVRAPVGACPEEGLATLFCALQVPGAVQARAQRQRQARRRREAGRRLKPAPVHHGATTPSSTRSPTGRAAGRDRG